MRRVQVRRPGPRVADEVRLTRRARLLEEARKCRFSFRVCVSVALVSTTPDPREPSPRVESKFPTRGEGSCVDCWDQVLLMKSAGKATETHGTNITETEPCLPPAAVRRTRAHASNLKSPHSRHPRERRALPVVHRRLPRAQLRGHVEHHHRTRTCK
jgi:hypothetical protein